MGIKVEFAINISDERDLFKVGEALKKKGIEITESNLASKSVQVDIDHQNPRHPNIQELQSYIENETGYTTVIKGLGILSSAVAELRPPTTPATKLPAIHGVLRLTQHDDGACLFDGSIGTSNRLQEQCYRLAVHEYGDLSDVSFNSIGEPMLVIDDNCSSSVKRTVPKCNVASLIGRSIALTESSSLRVLSAGIIARASTVELNTKQVCSCSGKTLWQERLDQREKEARSS